MVREDCGIEAKEAAVREAYKLLPLPELLASISSWIKSRYIARQQVDQTRSALEALSLSISKDHKQSSSLHGNYADIKKYASSTRHILFKEQGLRSDVVFDENTTYLLVMIAHVCLWIRLCQECQTLIENYEQIKLLSNMRNNLNTTLKDVEGMMSTSVKASEAMDSLSDNKELINTFEVPLSGLCFCRK
ncbi:hypothetical protein C5167_028106 [Papaver somniferum]|nr:hypothetical protein C5167_028106 [Papaver somniferum]